MNPKIFFITFIIFFSYLVIMTLYNLLLVFIGAFQNRKRLFESSKDDYSFLLNSDFTIPVSILVPVHNEEIWVANCIKSLLGLYYKEYEIIIIDDGSTDNAPSILNEMLDLQAKAKSFESRFKDGKVHEIFKSRKYDNVTVVRKSGLRKAGALNAGLNFAKYKYICNIDADTILEPDSLLKVMAQVEKNPEEIVGVGSFFGLVNGFDVKDGKVMKRSFSYNPLIGFQLLEYIRAFIGYRISWSALNAMPIVSGGFGLWRRDVLIEAGGYSPDFTCEDIEFTFRVHDMIVKKNKDMRIVSLPNYIGWTEGPEDIRSLIIQRSRWQRVTIETIAAYKHMLFNPKYKWFAFLTLPYFLFYEVFGVFFELGSIAIVFWAWFSGLLNVAFFFGFLLFMGIIQALISDFVLLIFTSEQKLFPLPYLAYLFLLSFFEVFVYRWIIMIGKIKGFMGFMRGVKTFDQYNRKAR